MQVKTTHTNPTKAVVAVIAHADELNGIKLHVLSHFNNVKVPGFREGKVPADLLEKHIDSNVLQPRFLEEAIEQLYSQALKSEALRAVGQPKISIKKFVPFTDLEFDAEVDVIGTVKLADYKKISVKKPEIKVTVDDVKNVMESLRNQLAEKEDVDRAAKNADQVWIDFKGVDAKGAPINGADGENYPLTLGSNAFIPGFEEQLIGKKAGDETTFTVTFPKDYGVSSLQNKKVTFTVSISKVQEVVLPKVDDELAKKAGPFKTLAELKADIKKQLTHERNHEVQRDYESELMKKISDKSTVDLPQLLIDEQIERMMTDLRQNLTYRGQTMQEYLKEQQKSEEEYKTEVVKPQAEARTKASVLLAEISERENLTVTPEEISVRIQLLKGQYKDAQMQAELDKPEARREIASRLLTEKTIAKVVEYAAA